MTVKPPFVLACAVVGMIAANRAVSATALTIVPPAGWVPAGEAFAASGTNVAIALRRAGGGLPTRLLQWRDGTVVLTDLPGKILAAHYSPAGDRVLVSLAVPAEGATEGAPQTAIIDAEGSVAWTQAGSWPLGLSVGGTSLYAWRKGDRRLEVRNWAGELVREWTFLERAHAALTIGDGRQLVVAEGMTILSYSVADGELRTDWQLDLPSRDGAFESLVPFDATRFILDSAWGAFTIVDVNGKVVHAYSPCAMDASHPGTAWQDHARHRPQATTDPDTVLLFDTEAPRHVLDLQSGEVSPLVPAVSVPPGYRLLPFASDSKLLLVGPTDVRLISIPGL